MAQRFRYMIRDLFPGYFGFVMATEILSIGAYFLEFFLLSKVLLYVGLAGYIILIILFSCRLGMFPRRVLEDMVHPQRVFFYFTFVAGTDNLATRFLLNGNYFPASVLGMVGLCSAIILVYFILSVLIFHNKLSLHKSINASWLFMTVGCQSVVIILSQLFQKEMLIHHFWIILAQTIWIFGLIVYVIFFVYILNHLFFKSFSGKDFSPVYWISMGAMAITIVASDGLKTINPFISGMAIVLWGWATALIPLLILSEAIKYWVFKEPVKYQPALWSMVFPMGMYTVATYIISRNPGFEILVKCLPIFFFIAIFFWIMTSLGLVIKTIRS